MKTKKFVVVQTVVAELEISEDLLDSVLTDEWRSSFYRLEKPEDVAAHLAYNLVRGASLQSLDGFADRKEEDVKFRDTWDIESSEEIK